MNAYQPTPDTCGCCEGVHILTPAAVANRPGLAALVYRVGTHGSFTATMQAALSRYAALQALKTRDNDDPTLALLDAWAMVLDVLTFYQERLANEAYLRTATERRSVLELARAIGYALSPGVTANTDLAFELETAPGSPEAVTIAVGTLVQSLPGPDERPQLFETVEAITARPAWNALKPRQTMLHLPATGDQNLYLKGVTTNLRPGDLLLMVGQERVTDAASDHWEVRRLTAVDLDAPADRTLVRWSEPLGSIGPHEPPQQEPKVYALRLRAALFGHNAPLWDALPVSLRVGEWGPTTESSGSLTLPFLPGAYAGSAATWADASFPATQDTLNLDTVYSQVSLGSWLVLASPDAVELYRVIGVAEESIADFNLSAKTTRLEIEGKNIDQFSRRTASVYAQSEELALAETPLTEAVQGDAIVLDQVVESLQPGRKLIVSGKRTLDNTVVAELATLKEAVAEDVHHSKLAFTQPLHNEYDRTTVTIYANVALATHGETRHEVLGSGDAAQVFQQFVLRQTPLTFVPAPTPSGAASTLTVRVNDVVWNETPSLYGLDARQQVYTERLADDGKVSVQFGDGASGARLPSGLENIMATYRVGTGQAGMVQAGQLSLLITRPFGVKGVTNPLAATGAADPEQLSAARQNAPLTVRTLDRVVSLQDYEDFARAFAGIGKAQATWLWAGDRQLVHLTVAAVNGGAVEPASLLYHNLQRAIAAAGETLQPWRLETYQPRLFHVAANILVDRRYIAAQVMAAVTTVLQHAFAFPQRAFGQPVTQSEVLATMQAVDGVVAVALDQLYVTGAGPSLHPILLAQRARWDQSMPTPQIRPAELLTLYPAGITLSEMPS